MKETKVYVDELPESCSKCLFCYDNRPYWKSTDCILLGKELDEDEIEIKREKDCSLVDIKTHDRQLIKELCEKIRSDLQSGLKRFKPKPDDVLTQFIYNLDNKLHQIQKECDNGGEK